MNVTDMSQPSKTAYDDAFLTLLHDCSHLIIPVVNLIFNKNYTGQETIIFAPNEFYLSKAAGGKEKRITDSCFSIVGADGKAIHYHFECESNLDQSIMLRVYSYDSLISSRNAMAKGYSVVAQYPRTAVLALRYQKAMPDAYPVLIENGDGSLKVQCLSSRCGNVLLRISFVRTCCFYCLSLFLLMRNRLKLMKEMRQNCRFLWMNTTI